MAVRHATIDAYLEALPPDRRALVDAIRGAIDRNIEPRFGTGMQYGMPAWFLPHAEYPAGYHCDPRQPVPFASVASQKHHVGIYLFCIYTDPAARARFAREWRDAGARLDMGASCVRVKRLDEVPLEVLGRAISRVTVEDFIAAYERSRPAGATGRRAARHK